MEVGVRFDLDDTGGVKSGIREGSVVAWFDSRLFVHPCHFEAVGGVGGIRNEAIASIVVGNVDLPHAHGVVFKARHSDFGGGAGGADADEKGIFDEDQLVLVIGWMSQNCSQVDPTGRGGGGSGGGFAGG